MPTDAGNTIVDFPPEEFTVLAFCDACGHQAPVDWSAFPKSTIVQDLPRRLRCSACGSKNCSIRIVYTRAGGYRHSL